MNFYIRINQKKQFDNFFAIAGVNASATRLDEMTDDELNRLDKEI